VVPVSDPGRDCGELSILDRPAALWIDTCTLSPLLRGTNDCSGTFSSIVSPPCIRSLMVCSVCWSGIFSPLPLHVTFIFWPLHPGCTALRYTSSIYALLRRSCCRESNSYTMSNDAVLHSCWHRFCLYSMLKLKDKTYEAIFYSERAPSLYEMGLACWVLSVTSSSVWASRKLCIFRVRDRYAERQINERQKRRAAHRNFGLSL
jgi:hypothetical protein